MAIRDILELAEKKPHWGDIPKELSEDLRYCLATKLVYRHQEERIVVIPGKEFDDLEQVAIDNLELTEEGFMALYEMKNNVVAPLRRKAK